MDTTTTPEKKASLEGVVSRGNLRRMLEGKQTPVRFRPTKFDHVLLEVADGAVQTGVPTAIVLPVAGTKTPVLLAASMLIAHFVRTQKMNANIALVSKQVGLRQFYDSLYLEKYCHLADCFPRTVVDTTGLALDDRKVSGKLSSEELKRRGRLHFVPGLNRLDRMRFRRSSSLIEPDGLVVESQACDEDNLCKLFASMGGKIPIIYLTVDPFDPALSLFRESGAVRAWDAAQMASFVDAEPNDDAICTGAEVVAGLADTSFEVAGSSGDSEFDVSLARLWDDLMEIQRSPTGLSFDSVGWTWGVFAALSQLLVPLEDYERYARLGWNTATLSDAPEKAGAFGRNAPGEYERELWEVLADDMHAAIEAARGGNSKPERAAGWVRDLLEEGSGGVIVVRNRVSEKALDAYLDAHPGIPWGWRTAIRIAALSDLVAGRKALGTEAALFPGPLPSRYGWMFALPPTGRVTVLAHGPWEASRAVRQIQVTAQQLETLARGGVREQAMARLFGPGSVVDAEPPPAAPRIVHSGIQANKVPSTVRDAVWSPFDLKIAKLLRTRDVDVVASPRTSLSGGAEGSVEAVLIELDDGEGYFEPNCRVSRLREKVEEVAAKSLKPGDRIMLIECGARRDLFMHIAKKLEDLPGWMSTVSLVELWHEQARLAGLQSGLDNEQILARMNGTTITGPGTIGAWIKGVRHGPNKAEDIRRFGEAVGDDVLVSRWQMIGQAITTIRGHRIGLGKWLNAKLAGVSGGDTGDDGYFDRRLGMHYSDLMDAVSVHRVRSVSTSVTIVPQLKANRLLEAGEPTTTGG